MTDAEKLAFAWLKQVKEFKKQVKLLDTKIAELEETGADADNLKIERSKLEKQISETMQTIGMILPVW